MSLVLTSSGYAVRDTGNSEWIGRNGRTVVSPTLAETSPLREVAVVRAQKLTNATGRRHVVDTVVTSIFMEDCK